MLLQHLSWGMVEDLGKNGAFYSHFGGCFMLLDGMFVLYILN